MSRRRQLTGLLLGAAIALTLAAGCDRTPPERSRRLFLIGIDGATWDLMDPLLAEGRLPHLASLIAEGSRAPLRSMIPTKSPAIWTSAATGKTFEKHGINDFTYAASEDGLKTPRVMHMTSNMRKTKALWNIVGEKDLRTAFVGWWVTWPAEPVNGYMISSHVPLSQTGGKAAPTKGTLVADMEGQTWPPELFAELEPSLRSAESVTYDEAKRFMDVRPHEMSRNVVEGFRWGYAADETYRAAARHVLDQDPDLDLIGIYFNGVDVVGHRYWKYIEPEAYPKFPPSEIPRFEHVIDRYYDYTDELIGDILARRRPGDTFIVLSDHGFHALGHADGPDGIFIAAGHNVRRRAPLEPPHILDIAPTTLALLGMPAAADMDGRVLEELFTDDWRDAHPREKVSTYDTEDWREQIPIPSNVDNELLERLHALGYLE